MKLSLINRTNAKKSETKKIRREGDIPAVLYGHGHSVELVTVKGTEFQAMLRHLKQGGLSTTIFELHHNSKPSKAIIKDIQYNPVTYAVEHIDFVLLSQDKPVTINVPIQILGAAECPGIRLGGTLRQVIRSMKISCLPKDIPSAFQIDIRDLNIAGSKRLSDIAIPESIRPKALMNEVAVVIAKGKVAT